MRSVQRQYSQDSQPVQRHSLESRRARLEQHVREVLACERCPKMHKPVVSGGPVWSEILLIGQAPGDKEPIFRKPWAWTAGKTLFKWFQDATGVSEAELRQKIYIAAVCRCFPGKKATGGDRVPTLEEVSNCATWLERELEILQPRLVIAVGRLAINQFLAFTTLEEIIGKQFEVSADGHRFDLIPLPHPSGASPWPRVEPGRTLLSHAFKRIESHPTFRRTFDQPRQAGY